MGGLPACIFLASAESALWQLLQSAFVVAVEIQYLAFGAVRIRSSVAVPTAPAAVPWVKIPGKAEDSSIEVPAIGPILAADMRNSRREIILSAQFNDILS